MVYESHRAHPPAGAREVNSIVSAFLLTFAALFPIVNPLEGAPFFLGLTAGIPGAERRVLARKAAVNGFALLLGSMVLGPWMLEVFGIQLPVVRIAGGLVVAALGWKLLAQEQWSEHGAGLQAESARKVGSFYPLTMPLTVGPGSMSVAITIGSRETGGVAAAAAARRACERCAARSDGDRPQHLSRLPLRGEHRAAAR